ncbi:MAG TPA: MlaD family protein, partial [Tepidisphaeraceae bacterium]|nr:MlaD family protein [Tepidisphaeraceae bacterium]
MHQRNELKAGLFIVISFALAVAIFFGITGSSWFTGPTKTYAVDFDLSEDVGGMKTGSVVRIGGLSVGKVTKVEIVHGEAGTTTRALFTLPVEFRLKQGAQIALQSGIIGTQVNLNITSMGIGSELNKGDVIDGSPSPLAAAIKGLGVATEEIVPMVRDIRNVTVPKVNNAIDNASNAFVEAKDTAIRFKITADKATELVEHVRSKIDPAFDKYHIVGDNAAGAAANVRDIFGDSKRDFRETIANFNVISTDLKVKLPEIADKVSTALDGFKTTLDKTGGLLAEVQKIADNASNATVTVRSILASNRAEAWAAI